jgi:hypothetical protein
LRHRQNHQAEQDSFHDLPFGSSSAGRLAPDILPFSCQDGNQKDPVDARKRSDLLHINKRKPVYHDVRNGVLNRIGWRAGFKYQG